MEESNNTQHTYEKKRKQHNKLTVKFVSCGCWFLLYFLECVSMRQNCFKHLILNYLDDIGWIDWCNCPLLLFGFHFFSLSFDGSVLNVHKCWFRDLFAFSSSSLTYLREMIEQCLQANVLCSFLLSLSLSISWCVSILIFIDRTIKTITVIKTERKNNKSKHRVDFLHCTMPLYAIKVNTLRFRSIDVRCDFIRRFSWLIVRRIANDTECIFIRYVFIEKNWTLKEINWSYIRNIQRTAMKWCYLDAIKQ